MWLHNKGIPVDCGYKSILKMTDPNEQFPQSVVNKCLLIYIYFNVLFRLPCCYFYCVRDTF